MDRSSGLVGTATVRYGLEKTKHHLILVDSKPPSDASWLTNSRIEFHSADLLDSEVCVISIMKPETLRLES